LQPIRRALVSVSDKTGVTELGRELAEMGVEILSTGGTMRALAEAGVAVTAVDSYTGFPEMMDGRVKTLHPKIHGGLLALRGNPTHMAQAAAHGVGMIDLVVCNLYPFQATVARPQVTLEEAVEQIDIGGPSMIRSAAKNLAAVTVVCNPARYPEVLAEMHAHDGAVTDETRRRLALEAFTHTARYDSAIATWLGGQFRGDDSGLPPLKVVWLEKLQGLRYGENPHQRAALYREEAAAEPGIAGAEQHHGKELSYNNLVDLMSAMEAARDFTDPTAVIIKHNNPCGAASAPTLAQAFTDAWVCDPVSAFGGVIALNRVVDVDTARLIGNAEVLREAIVPRYQAETGDTESTVLAAFVEAIIAPGYESEALALLKQRANLRVLEQPAFAPPAQPDFALRQLTGGALLQDPDAKAVTRGDCRVVTKLAPTEEQWPALLFADRIAKHVKSNAIVLCSGTRTLGIGAGQMSRVDSSMIAAHKAGRRAQGSVLASDAMFPARDGLDAAARTGAVAVIQPGGSVRDEEVIAAADEQGIAMVLTGMRHFRH